MYTQQGFSLIEVLTSLLLITTLILALLQQQAESRLLLKKITRKNPIILPSDANR